ncbi:MAG: hypothetical protein LH614_03880 [Pyrinomonadaceae bacterium]|nr:hypothetical protein [Pyrinomonadaceae bacterium]
MKNLNLLHLCLIFLIFSFAAPAQEEEVKINPNAPADYDANLKPGEMAVGIYSGSPETVKIVSKSGGVYKVKEQSSPNQNVLYFKANSVYPYFDWRKVMSLVNEYRYALEPYVESYVAKHNLSKEAIKGDGFQFNIGHSNAADLKKNLERGLGRLAELEGRLTEIQAFPQTFAQFEYNPALVREIAVSRNEYFQMLVGQKKSLRFEESVWLMAHRDGIQKALKNVNDYDPATKTTMGTNSEYALYAVSPKARTKWLTDTKTLEFKEPVDALLAPLAEALAKKLPGYLPPLKDYSLRSPGEEAMMKQTLGSLARCKIFASGMMPGGWKIETNSLGIPMSRYKHGMIYLRDTQADHPYCHATYVNIIQKYAGGGTYAASRASIVSDTLVGCPAGK